MSFLFERPEAGERAVLVHVEPDGVAPAERAEFEELAAAAGAERVGEVFVRRRDPDPATYVGSGKAAEIQAAVADCGAEVVIVDHALGPAQERNLEREVRCRVLDRISLILDIFAQRARSYEGKLQVELAQLRHLSTRLVRGWTHLERQKGGIGLRGPGETQLETDRRLLSARIRQIERRLDAVARRRTSSRRARDRAGVPVVSLVGYTNAGKSTVFNALTGAGVLAANRLFETLDPTLRRLELPGAPPVVLADTVGFIRQLPHELVAAFRATLEETLTASVLLHVIDASDPERRAKMEQVAQVLAEIGADEVPQIEVYNKIDRLTHDPLGTPGDASAPEPVASPRVEHGADGRAARVWVSARENLGLDLLSEAVASHFTADLERLRLRLPLELGRLRARLFEVAVSVEELDVGDTGWLMEVVLRRLDRGRLAQSESLDRYIEPAPAPLDLAGAERAI